MSNIIAGTVDAAWEKERRKHGLKPHSKKARKILRRLEAEERQADYDKRVKDLANSDVMNKLLSEEEREGEARKQIDYWQKVKWKVKDSLFPLPSNWRNNSE